MKLKHNPSIDSLRFFSIVCVIVAHYGPTVVKSQIARGIKNLFDGELGVDIFFVISGYLISYGLFIQKEKSNFSIGKELRNFYIKRFFRIFPIYYLLLLFLAIINYHSDIRDYFWYYVTYTSNFLSFKLNKANAFAHSWSLSVEEQFYLLFPFLIFIVKSKTIKYFLYVFIVASIISAFAMEFQYGRFSWVLLQNCLFTLCSGSLLAYFWLHEPEKISKWKLPINIVGVLSAIVFIAIKLFEVKFPYSYFISTTKILDTGMAVAILNLVIQKPNIATNKITMYIGKISYGIYLYHYVMIKYPIFSEDGHIVSIPVAYYVNNIVRLVLTLGLSIVSYELLEKRLINYCKTKLVTS